MHRPAKVKQQKTTYKLLQKLALRSIRGFMIFATPWNSQRMLYGACHDKQHHDYRGAHFCENTSRQCDFVFKPTMSRYEIQALRC